jgi:hypothetical protein
MTAPPAKNVCIDGAHFRSDTERGNRAGMTIAAQEVFGAGIALLRELD